jgi:hypothetical protein
MRTLASAGGYAPVASPSARAVISSAPLRASSHSSAANAPRSSVMTVVKWRSAANRPIGTFARGPTRVYARPRTGID